METKKTKVQGLNNLQVNRVQLLNNLLKHVQGLKNFGVRYKLKVTGINR